MESGLAEKVLEACGASDTRFYLDSIRRLYEQFDDYLHSESDALSYPLWEVAVGRELFNFLWRLRPKRYSRHSHLLTDLLDCYNSNNPDAGGADCTALTALYNILAEQMGIAVFTLDPGNHILSRIEASVQVNVENTSPKGFGVTQIQILKNHPVIDLNELPSCNNGLITATTYFNSAVERYHLGDFDAAWALNEKAWEVHPDISQAALRCSLMRIPE